MAHFWLNGVTIEDVAIASLTDPKTSLFHLMEFMLPTQETPEL